jgi:phenylpyruvate tautomerase PptA (4-oxalocrotonate tautomerase family)
MPLCQVLTNVPAPAPEAERALLADLSRLMAQRFEKPERWVMTCLVPGVSMTFGGTTAPTALVAVKNIGTMKPADTEVLSRDLCERLSKALAVPPERIYIQFTDAVDYLWGWNGGTLA